MRRVLAAAAVIVAIVIALGAWTGLQARPAVPGLYPQLVSVPGPVVPLRGDASAGRVTFTFDDGPDAYTGALLGEMSRLHIRGIFFVFGYKVALYPQLVHAMLAQGSRVEDHTYDHLSFSGASTDTPPLPGWKVRAELAETRDAIVAAGAPVPTLYRPPFGDISPAENAIAAGMGLRIVQPFSVIPHGLMVDSLDWKGLTPRQIAHTVEYGSDGHAGIRGGSVIGFHEASPGLCVTSQGRQPQRLCAYTVNVIRALPLIVRWMNRHHLGMTTNVPADSTGGAVPAIPVRPAKEDR